jgi:hypothetical protein
MIITITLVMKTLIMDSIPIQHETSITDALIMETLLGDALITYDSYHCGTSHHPVHDFHYGHATVVRKPSLWEPSLPTMSLYLH